MVSFHWLLTILASFWTSLVMFGDCGSCPLWFLRGARHLQYPWNNFSPGESPQNGTQPGPLLGMFLTLRVSPYFFHIPFISLPSKTLEKVPWEKGCPLDRKCMKNALPSPPAISIIGGGEVSPIDFFSHIPFSASISALGLSWFWLSLGKFV